jgi:methanogenic corrinoid protein MtbC1
MSPPRSSARQIERAVYNETQASLRQLVETLPGESVANLAREVLSRVAQRDHELPANLQRPTEDQIEELAHALIDRDDHAGADFIQNVQAMGASPEAIYLKYLAAAARKLGVWWEHDRVTFVQVTLGSGRIISIMRGMRSLFVPKVEPSRKAAVFAAVPGETHTIGIRMAADHFRKDGWDITLKIGLSHDELIESIDWSETGLIGLSIGGEHSVEALTRLILAIRVHGPAVEVLVSGQDTPHTKELAKMLGADASVGTADEAIPIMNAMWDRILVRQ